MERKYFWLLAICMPEVTFSVLVTLIFCNLQNLSKLGKTFSYKSTDRYYYDGDGGDDFYPSVNK